MNKIKKNEIKTIIINKTANYKYFIEKKFYAGICFQGWEIKCIRKNKINITNSYVLCKNGEAYLFGIIFQPLISIAKNSNIDKNQKLLLKRKEIDNIYGFVKKKGYTVVLLSLFWKKFLVKAEIGIAKGKTEYDQRNLIKKREWQMNKEKIIKKNRYK